MIIMYAVGLIAAAVLLYAVVGIVMTCGGEWIRRLGWWFSDLFRR